MEVITSQDATQMGRKAAENGSTLIRQAIEERGSANIIVATGASQFEVFNALTVMGGIDWSKVTGFHLDEYIGLPLSHPASFRGYLKERFVDTVSLAAFHYVDGEASDPEAECQRVGALIAEHPIDVAFVGIGENGHLAFNDPPADFGTEQAYIVVNLDDDCRKQQLGEGWFKTLDDVPEQAISMSIKQILLSRAIICSVPDERKAEAVVGSIEGPVTPQVPASIMQQHANATIYLDAASASQLKSN